MTSLPSSYTPKKTIYFGENNLFINQPLDNVYVRSKFEAEKFGGTTTLRLDQHFWVTFNVNLVVRKC